MWHWDARPLSEFLSPADFQLSRSLLAIVGKGLRLPCSLAWEHPRSPSGAAEVCWYACNAAPAGREHPALAETFQPSLRPSRHGLPSPALPFRAEGWGWGAQSCQESKAGGCGRCGKGSSGKAEFAWVPPLCSPKVLLHRGASLGTSSCWPKLLCSQPLCFVG